MHGLTGEAEVRDGGDGVLAWKTVQQAGPAPRLAGNFAPLLSGIVLVDEPALRLW